LALLFFTELLGCAYERQPSFLSVSFYFTREII